MTSNMRKRSFDSAIAPLRMTWHRGVILSGGGAEVEESTFCQKTFPVLSAKTNLVYSADTGWFSTALSISALRSSVLMPARMPLICSISSG